MSLNDMLIGLLIGFVSAAIAVLTVHQMIILILTELGFLKDSRPWSVAPTGPFYIPKIVNSVFWGGLWGMVYVFYDYYQIVSTVWVKGLIFGVLIALISDFILLPLLKKKPLFMGFESAMIFSILTLLGGFGITTALLFEFFTHFS